MVRARLAEACVELPARAKKKQAPWFRGPVAITLAIAFQMSASI